jgi:hypothetical protein
MYIYIKRFEEPIDPYTIFEVFIPPQSFCYINENFMKILALMGYWHGQKKESTGHSSEVQPCTQQLKELGVTLYTVQVTGISGYAWTEEFKTSPRFNDPENIEFPDNSTLGDILEVAPEYHMVYIDFQQEENASISLGISSICYINEAAEIFDSLVLYKYFTPLWPGEIFEEANSLFEKGVNDEYWYMRFDYKMGKIKFN